MRFLLVFFICLILSLNAFAEDVDSKDLEKTNPSYAVLEVKLKSSKFTEYFPECGEDCVPWSFWNKYQAKVAKVLYGEFDSRSIEFVYLQHAGFAKVKNRKAYIIIDKFTDEKSIKLLGTPYFAYEVNFPYEAVCFDTSLIEEVAEDASSEVWQYDYVVTSPQDRCYSTNDLVVDDEEE